MKKIIFLLILIFSLFWCSKNTTLNQDESFTQTWNIQKTILALWDSLTAWYWVLEQENYPYKLKQTLQENWYNYEIINAWVSGDTSDNVLSRVDLYLDNPPDILILVVWWNDWLRWLSTENLKLNIQKIISKFDIKKTKIILAWMQVPNNLWEKYSLDFKKVYEDIATENKNIYFYPFFLDKVELNPELTISDNIHPNSKWYDIIVKNLYDFILKNNILTK